MKLKLGFELDNGYVCGTALRTEDTGVFFTKSFMGIMDHKGENIQISHEGCIDGAIYHCCYLDWDYFSPKVVLYYPDPYRDENK